MFHNRIATQLECRLPQHAAAIAADSFVRVESCPLPRPAAPEIAPGSFVRLPLEWMPVQVRAAWLSHQWLYQLAFEQAQAVVRPSLLERDLLGVWN